MGWVKNHLMEIQEMGDWPGGLSDKMVCSHHFHDHYLNDIILENGVTMFATGKVTNERWTCAEEGFVLVTTTNLSATLREPSLSSER